jgi:hypothetical protein
LCIRADVLQCFQVLFKPISSCGKKEVKEADWRQKLKAAGDADSQKGLEELAGTVSLPIHNVTSQVR